jgi:Domain of unknown function (DUF1876)
MLERRRSRSARRIPVKVHGESKVWTIEVVLEENDSETEAKAVLRLRDRELGGWGRARRNPLDPDRPRVGEELAAARALSELSHKLVDAAAVAIEEFEGQRVHLHG